MIVLWDLMAGWWWLEHDWIMNFHSVGNFMIPTGPNSMIFQRGGEKPPTSWYIDDALCTWLRSVSKHVVEIERVQVLEVSGLAFKHGQPENPRIYGWCYHLTAHLQGIS